jgi:hypothetical protein
MTELIIIGTLVTVILGQLGFVGWITHQHGKERRELYSRLMARDLTEFSAVTGTRPPPQSRNIVLSGLKKSAKMYQESAGDQQ